MSAPVAGRTANVIWPRSRSLGGGRIVRARILSVLPSGYVDAEWAGMRATVRPVSHREILEIEKGGKS